MRRFGPAPQPARRYTRRPGVYAILLRGSDILLTHQSRPEPEFQLPGGGIDPGEHPAWALHREVLEETGWTIGRLRRLSVHRRFTFMPDYDLWAEKLCTIYLARPILWTKPPSEPDHRTIWVPLTIAPEMVASPGERIALARVRGDLMQDQAVDPRNSKRTAETSSGNWSLP